MTVTESSWIFLNSENAEEEVKHQHYIAVKVEDCIKEVEAQNVIQIIISNISAYKGTGAIMENNYPHIFELLVYYKL